MQLTNTTDLQNLIDQVENERMRLQGWSKLVDSQKFKDKYLYRARRLGKIRENLRELMESYSED